MVYTILSSWLYTEVISLHNLFLKSLGVYGTEPERERERERPLYQAATSEVQKHHYFPLQYNEAITSKQGETRRKQRVKLITIEEMREEGGGGEEVEKTKMNFEV